VNKSTTSTPAEQALATTVEPSSLDVLKQAIQTIPWVDTDPTERMTEFILNEPPEKWEELFAGLPSIRDLAGTRVVIHALRIRESDFEGPLGVYLIADVTFLPSGEKGLMSISSQMSIVQLTRLYALGKLPATVEIVQKDKPTKAGFRPIHLRYIDAGNTALGDPGAVVSEQ
jgi:hypothetical protein